MRRGRQLRGRQGPHRQVRRGSGVRGPQCALAPALAQPLRTLTPLCVPAEGANAYTKCEKKRDAERAEGKREMCDPDTWVKLVELALAARERGDSDLELGPEFEVRSPVEPAKFGGGSTDTPEKQKARLERCELPRPHALGHTPSTLSRALLAGTRRKRPRKRQCR